MPASRMVPLTSCPFAFEAKVLTARLGAEGIVWQASANLDSIYPVGDVEVLVEVEDLDRARELLEVAGFDDDESAPWRAQRGQRWMAGIVLGLVLLFVVARLLAGQ